MSALLTRGPDWQRVIPLDSGCMVLFDALVARTQCADAGAAFQGILLQPAAPGPRQVLLWACNADEQSFVPHAHTLRGHLEVLSGARSPRVLEVHFSMPVPGVLRARCDAWQYGPSGCTAVPPPELGELLAQLKVPQARFVEAAFELLDRANDPAR